MQRRHGLGFANVANRLALHALQFLKPYFAKKAELLIVEHFPLHRLNNPQKCILLQLNDLSTDGFEVPSTFLWKLVQPRVHILRRHGRHSDCRLPESGNTGRVGKVNDVLNGKGDDIRTQVVMLVPLRMMPTRSLSAIRKAPRFLAFYKKCSTLERSASRHPPYGRVWENPGRERPQWILTEGSPYWRTRLVYKQSSSQGR
jgi:hypothetical protein